MAMYTVLRRATAAVVPLAARRAAVSSSSRAFHSVISVKLLVHKETTPSRSFSNAVAKKPVADDNLIQVLQTKIDCALEVHAEQVEIPEEFPFKIEEIENGYGNKIIQLKRQYEDETITVRGGLYKSGRQPERQRQRQCYLDVTVFKGNGMCLEVDVTALPDKVTIGSISIKKPVESEDQPVYERDHKFTDLDENLQNTFLKYLEFRGITHGTINFLQEYIFYKDNEPYLVWLQNMKSFFKK